MLETSARLLRLLSLLQSRTDWTGPELAERLGVTTRTVRNDVERLRRLGYPVHATPGVAGGYRLGVGARLPPLLLDDQEAVAVAVGLRTAANGTVAGIQESSVRALAKLEQVLPHHLRERVNALQRYTVATTARGPTVEPATLTAIAAACRDHQRLRFDYRAHDGTEGLRTVEPHRLVHTGRRWYLVAWDTERHDWRTFRVDRMAPRSPAGPRFAPRTPPHDVAALVSRGVDAALFRHRARVTVHKPAREIAQWLPEAVAVEAVDDRTCLVHVGADTPHLLAAHIAMLDADFEVDGPPEVVAALRRISGRLARAAGGP